MEQKKYRLAEKSTTLIVREGSKKLFELINQKLKEKGFKIQKDQRILKEYPTLSDSHFEGEKKGLLFKSNIYPNGFKFEFYQEENVEHARGGYYDFHKYEMMPYLIRCEFKLTMKAILEVLHENGFVNEVELESKNSYETVMQKIKSCWHYTEGKELPEHEFPKYNATDRDGNQLRNGQVKYFRDYKGRLMRGTIYHNINNMWWVIINKHRYTNEGASSFFDLKEGEKVERKIKNKKMPQRIKAEKLRTKFKELGLDYSQIKEEDIQDLRDILKKEIKLFNSDMEMSLSKEKKKDMKILKRTGLKFAEIKVDGYYFSGREAITFNEDGFIGFAGWACDYNVTPFVSAFEIWMNQLKKEKEKAA